ncbi:ssl1498 family light-harvesting-like protein [Lusitaniella coriacea LEGE 07157]|uniref:Ssl1498 family light-harvesting-like protein n=1 Tax=Lusitaniella coriacea LEGE 07157 TaxID=945747 RepID=A0A8J7DZM9_9CYAN|nr:ssl1498 family light-harvesting-like protein [Lusitaniella coriacea]MBE9118257.1 ssl1498 family light-harvesting-like protein [Lusitaniella coriacea LEGE 07157]
MTQSTNSETPGAAQKNYSDGSELKPAEVGARQEREGNEPPNQPSAETTKKSDPQAGYTVSRDGLVNNYATTPKVYKAEYPSPEEQRKYVVLGAIALGFVLLLTLTAVLVS